MSKIADALEKAKKEGVLERTAGGADVPGLRPTTGDLSSRRDVRRAPGGPVGARELDPEMLRGVDDHLEALHKPMSVVSEQYRAIRSRLERLNSNGRLQLLAVTSAVKGEGKSVTAANIAVVLAQDATRRVLLVDADLRRPKVQRLFGLEDGPGLAEYLQETATWEDVVRPTAFFGLTVLTAGAAVAHPSELLASAQFEGFAAEARARFDLVVVDTPPLYPISDVNFLAEAVDGVVLVVRAHRTSRAIIRVAAEALPAQKLLGTVLNRAENLSAGYGYNSGYYYKGYY